MELLQKASVQRKRLHRNKLSTDLKETITTIILATATLGLLILADQIARTLLSWVLI